MRLANNKNGNGPFWGWANRWLIKQVEEASGPHDEAYEFLIKRGGMIRDAKSFRAHADLIYYRNFKAHGANWWERQVTSRAHYVALRLFGGWNIKLKRWMRR